MIKDKITIINSEQEIKKELNRNFNYNRCFEQKNLYFGEGAKNFYVKSSNFGFKKLKNDLLKEEILFLKKKLDKNKRFVIISLGCGNCLREINLLNNLYSENYNFDYIGVDSSFEMIKLGEENLKGSKFNVEFILADFSKENFDIFLKKKILNYEKKIFFFFGNTLGNVPQSYIADTLRSLLSKKDILWLEVGICQDLNIDSISCLFTKYINYVKDSKSKEFYLSPIKNIGILENCGELILSTSQEESPKNVTFNFSFLIKKNIEVKIENKNILLLKNDNIYISSIRIYQNDSLINFFLLRDFRLLHSILGSSLGEFI